MIFNTAIHDLLTPLLIPCVVAALNIVLLVWTGVRNRPVIHACLKCAAFAIFTVTSLRAGIVPTQPPLRFAQPEIQFIRGLLETVWWLLAAATIVSVARTYYAAGLRLRQHRFKLDIIETLLYLGASVAIVTDVLGIPLKGVLATSGALAIVLGLALQSSLSDLFSGLLINATTPYRVGDSVVFDDTTEGQVVEITWRATHLASANRDLIVVPNSIVAKSRIRNRSYPDDPMPLLPHLIPTANTAPRMLFTRSNSPSTPASAW